MTDEQPPYWPPSEEDTQHAVDAAAAVIQTSEAQHAVTELIIRLIATVRELDQDYDVARYLKSIRLNVNGPGLFSLEIDPDFDTIDGDALLQAAMAEAAATYHKTPRDIRLDLQGANDANPPRPDSHP